MIIKSVLIVSLGSLPSIEYPKEPKFFADAIPYAQLYNHQDCKKYQDTQKYNTINSQELININNEKIIQQLYYELK